MTKPINKYEHREFSHIINIFSQEPNADIKGNLYLGNMHTFKDGCFKYKFGIDCVLTIIDEQRYRQSFIESKLSKQQVTYHKWIDIEDDPDLSIYPYLHDSHSYIKEMLNETNVLVHCRMGISRSASLVIAFLIKEYGMSYAQAKKYTKQRRDIIKPNQGFVRDLLKFQAQLKSVNVRPAQK